MKKHLHLLFILSLAIAFKAGAQDKQTIIKTMEAQRMAWNKGDLTAFMQAYWH